MHDDIHNMGTSALPDMYICMMLEGAQCPRASADISDNASYKTLLVL